MRAGVPSWQRCPVKRLSITRKVPAVSLAVAKPSGLCQGDLVPLRFAGGHCIRRGTGCAIVGQEPLLKNNTSVPLCGGVAACW